MSVNDTKLSENNIEVEVYETKDAIDYIRSEEFLDIMKKADDKISEEDFALLHPDDRKHVEMDVAINMKKFGPWIIRYYPNSAMVVNDAIGAFGPDAETYLSNDLPCIEDVVSQQLKFGKVDYIKYLKEDQMEQHHEEILNAVKTNAATINRSTEISLSQITFLLKDFVKLPKTLSNYNEIAKVVGDCGRGITFKYLPDSVVDQIYAEAGVTGRKLLESCDGFDLLKTAEEYNPTGNEELSQFVKSKLQEFKLEKQKDQEI